MLKKGEVLAFKTDTVWGFGADLNDKSAVDKIYEIKKRDAKKPLILMSDDFSNLEKYIEKIPSYARELIKKHLPGGLTLIFKKSNLCPDYITSGADTIGIRVPNSPDFALALDFAPECVLATTSCNISNENPVEDYFEAVKKFKEVATIIKPINNNKTKNLPSTVVLCLDDEYKILRQGAVEL